MRSTSICVYTHHAYRLEAPVLSVTLHISKTTMSRREDFSVTSQVTFDSPAGTSSDSKAIMFHIYPFDDCYRLYRLRDEKWQRCETADTQMTGFRIVDTPDEKIKVAEHKDFVCLKPGESWTTEETIQDPGWTHIPEDSVVGDQFRYIFKGTELDWWTWGDKVENAETEVVLPCFIWANVQKPADNDGRPKLVVPGSNTVEFSIVED